MATLAGLVIKIRADLGDFVNNINDVTKGIQSMSGIISASSNSVKTLTDCIEALEVGLDAQNAAITNAANSNFKGLTSIIKGFDDLKTAVEEKSTDIASSIGSLTPSVDGFRKACEQMQELQKLDETMRRVTGGTRNLSAQLAIARQGMNQLAVGIVNAKMQAIAFSVVTYAQSIPFMLLGYIFRQLLITH